ncbi:pyridoxal phosphate-dependent aminotransferase [Amycolatopsis sp. NPDC059021]|uniref:pyridoxal phosphate-dependent aminotransferase n=1 Tax=Amycolatopsis sp. NPDC059021 TaxID=3346704 RepID=UPI0036720786
MPIIAADGQAGTILLDWNESPFGPPPAAIERIRAHAHEVHRYPRGLLESVTARLAAHYGVDADSVLLTGGVDEAIDLVLTSAGAAWYVTPGFDGYLSRARVLGRTPRPLELDADWQPRTAPADVAAGGVVFLAQPHNPTGNLFRREWIHEVADAAELMLLDTTYADFATAPVVTLDGHRNVVRFHSFSKVYGLAGIRLGALIGAPDLIATLRGWQRFQSVDSIALHAVDGALDDQDYLRRFRTHVLAARPRYVAELAAQPVFTEVRDTHTNFVVACCGNALSAAEVADRLLQHGVRVRHCDVLGLPGWLRVTVGTADDLAATTHALSTLDPQPAAL